MPKTVEYRGKRFDPITVEALKEVDKLVGPGISLQFSQGSYSNAVRASAGTHEGGGTGDGRASVVHGEANKEIVVLAGRLAGFAWWHRVPSQGPWPEHFHFVRIDCPDSAPLAKKQVIDYKNGKNGLAGHGKDDGPRLLDIKTWAEIKAILALPVHISNIRESIKGDRPGHQGVHPSEAYLVERALRLEGLLDLRDLDGTWGKSTTTALGRFQQLHGVPLLSDSLKLLGKRQGFKVKP